MHYGLLLLFLLSSGLVTAQESLFDALHSRGDSIQITIETDWKQLIRRKLKKGYLPATLRISGLDTPLELPGRVRARGNIRLQVCHYPSLKIKLKKEGLREAGFSDLNDLKMVLQCSSGDVGAGYHRREKLVYRLHAIYSEHSHRIVPLSLRIDDVKPKVLSAFFIEDEEQLTARYQGRVLESKSVSTNGLQREAYLNMCLFNYLILNTDWHVYNLHNIEFVNPNGTKDLVPIPYDFDYSGFVGAGYAVPNDALDMESIYEPKWLGKNVSADEIREAAKHFISKRAAAEKLIQEFPGLHKRNRRRLLDRMEEFYRLLAKEKELLRLIK